MNCPTMNKPNEFKEPKELNEPKELKATCQLSGGLGNQLFQVVTLLYYCQEEEVKRSPFLDDRTVLVSSLTHRPTYGNSVFAVLPRVDLQTLLFKSKLVFREPRFTFTPFPTSTAPFPQYSHEWIVLQGYFQSRRYFPDRSRVHAICKDMDWPRLRAQVLERFAANHPTIHLQEACAVHFRIGDYTKVQAIHPIQLVSYYEAAWSYLLKKNATIRWILVFCERKDKENVRQKVEEWKRASQIPSSSVTFVWIDDEKDEWKDWEQVFLMSGCAHHIIANSTFSWWGATLAEWAHQREWTTTTRKNPESETERGDFSSLSDAAVGPWKKAEDEKKKKEKEEDDVSLPLLPFLHFPKTTTEEQKEQEEEEVTVVCPRHWFGWQGVRLTPPLTTKDLLPLHWIQVGADEEETACG